MRKPYSTPAGKITSGICACSFLRPYNCHAKLVMIRELAVGSYVWLRELANLPSVQKMVIFGFRISFIILTSKV
jgi:hypothetical protein